MSSPNPLLQDQAFVGAEFFGGFEFVVDRAEEFCVPATQL